MKKFIIGGILLVVGISVLASCDDHNRTVVVPSQQYIDQPVVTGQPSTVIVNNDSHHDSGVGSFVAGAVVGSMLSGNNNSGHTTINNYNSNRNYNTSRSYSGSSSTTVTNRGTYNNSSRSSYTGRTSSSSTVKSPFGASTSKGFSKPSSYSRSSSSRKSSSSSSRR